MIAVYAVALSAYKDPLFSYNLLVLNVKLVKKNKDLIGNKLAMK